VRIDRTGRAALALCASAFLVYSALGLASHRALHTNAFDLSVFDYALWTTSTGGPIAYVPMFRHSLLAQHFMPTLLLLSPFARLFDGPAWLIVLQALFHASAAFLLYRFARRHASDGVALALTAAFLFSRRAHGAATSVFYIESAEPLLIIGALLARESRRLPAYWLLVVLALGCKEDVAMYFAVFGLVIAVVDRDRRVGIATTALSIVWLAVALGIAVPFWRGLYSLDSANPFLEGRYGGVADAAGRLGAFDSLSRLITVMSATGFACLLAPAWAAIALPGMLVNLAAAPGTLQAGLLGHYLWPILPWLFVAAAIGVGRFERRATFSGSPESARTHSGLRPPRTTIAISTSALSDSPRRTQRTLRAIGKRSTWLPLAILLVALIDLPLPRAIIRASWRQPDEAREVLEQLEVIPPDASVLAQPNLIPHLPRRFEMHSLGVYTAGRPDAASFVVLSREGDLWPFTAADIDKQVAHYAGDSRFERLTDGPLIVFRRR
jgi:uncharacterized membrane protein